MVGNRGQKGVSRIIFCFPAWTTGWMVPLMYQKEREGQNEVEFCFEHMGWEMLVGQLTGGTHSSRESAALGTET